MGKEAIFEEIMVKNFSKLMIDINLQIQEMPKIPSRKIRTKILENNRILVGKGEMELRPLFFRRKVHILIHSRFC